MTVETPSGVRADLPSHADETGKKKGAPGLEPDAPPEAKPK